VFADIADISSANLPRHRLTEEVYGTGVGNVGKRRLWACPMTSRPAFDVR
jgi:hypothetical protein